MSAPLNPTDLLFSVTSHEQPLEGVVSSPPQNIFVNDDELQYNEALHRKKTAASSPDQDFLPTADRNVMLPYFPDNPVIETASFKAYLLLVEENIFLQNEQNDTRNRRSRSQRRNLLGMSANVHNDSDGPADDTNPRHSFFENHLDSAESNDPGDERASPNRAEEDESVSESETAELAPAILRGILLFRVLKNNTKIKNINLNFKGDSRTNWPEGIPPKKTEFLEIENILKYDWPFFDVHDRDNPRYQKGGANHINTLPENLVRKGIEFSDIDNLDLNDLSNVSNSFFSSLNAVTSNSSQKSSSRKSKLFGLSKPKSVMNQLSGKASVFSKSSSSANVNGNGKGLELSAKAVDLEDKSSYFDSQGNYVFQPGDYIYNFEQTIPQSVPESLNLTFGFVNYWLNLEVVRSGKFKSTLRAKKKINLIRTNSSQSIEENYEPIMINKTWEDRLSYSILIASNSVILNSFIPINIRLVPTDKNVKLYKIKIFLVEILEYWCKNRKVHRLEPQRKFLLMEHKPKVGTNLLKDFEDINFNNSVITDKTGNGKKADLDKSAASDIPVAGSAGNGSVASSLSAAVNPDRLLPNLLNRSGNDSNISNKINDKKKGKKNKRVMPEDDEEEYISSKDFNYQLFVPEMFSKFSSKLHPDAKHKNIQCHHWIKISLRLSKKVDDFELNGEAAEAAAADSLRYVDPAITSDNSELNTGPSAPNANGSAFNRRSSFVSPVPKKKHGHYHSNSHDEEKPKRKHYEISIDSPITLLHPLCTQANTLLPAYDGAGLYDPYTYARKKSNGGIEILTNNNPLFPPEILGADVPPTTETILSPKWHNNGSNDDIHIVNPLDACKIPARLTADDTLLDSREDKPVPTGDDYANLDNEFQAEITPEMISSNLYQPRAIDLDLTSPQAMPMKPKIHNISLSPVTSARANDHIDKLLSPKMTPSNSETLQLSPVSTTQLSPNFRALSPALQALSPGLQALSPTLAARSPIMNSIDTPLVATTSHNVHPNYTGSTHSRDITGTSSEMHLMSKPPIKPPAYNYISSFEAQTSSKALNNLLIENGEELVHSMPPPTYDDVVQEKSQIKTLRKFQNAPIDDIEIKVTSVNDDDDVNDVANQFSFRGEDPNVPGIVSSAASPKITASSLTGFLSSSNNDDSSARGLDINSSISTGLLNEESSATRNLDSALSQNDGSAASFEGNSSSSSSIQRTSEASDNLNNTDKLPLLLTERENNSSSSLLKMMPSRLSTRLNHSITSIWNPVKNYNVGHDNENLLETNTNGDLYHNFEDDSKNDLGLQ